MKVSYLPINALNEVPSVCLEPRSDDEKTMLESIAKDSEYSFRVYAGFEPDDGRIIYLEIPMLLSQAVDSMLDQHGYYKIDKQWSIGRSKDHTWSIYFGGLHVDAWKMEHETGTVDYERFEESMRTWGSPLQALSAIGPLKHESWFGPAELNINFPS